MRIHSLFAIWLVLAGLATFPIDLRAQTAKPKLADELEDDLLKDLPKAKSENPSKAKTAKPAAKKEGEKKLLQDLDGGEDIGLPPENPLVRIGQQMKAIEEFDVTLTYCFTPGSRGVRDHYTSPPQRIEEFADFCAEMTKRYA